MERRVRPRPADRDRRNAPRLENGLVPLSEVREHFEIDPAFPDVRGWLVTVQRGTVVGSVQDLIIDPRALVARYAIVDLGPQGTDEGIGRSVLLSLAHAELRAGTDEMHFPRLTFLDVSGMPEYRREELDFDYEAGLLRRIGVHAVAELSEHEIEERHHDLEQPIERSVEPEAAAARAPRVTPERPDRSTGAPE